MIKNQPISVRSWLRSLADATAAFELRAVAPATSTRSKSTTADVVATLFPVRGRRQTRLLVNPRARLTPREAIAACAELAERKGSFAGVLIVCPFVSTRVAEICREHGVGYLDAAGNCEIRADGLVIHVTGRPNVAPDTRALLNPFAAKASRVVRVMLIQPSRAWRLQELAAKAKISLGLAFKAKDALIEQGYAEEREDGVSVRNPRALLDAWRAAYVSPARRSQYYVMDDTASAESAVARWCDQHRVDYGLADFSGAWHLAPMVRHKQASICVRESPSTDILASIISAVKAKPVETGSNLVISLTSDDAVFFDAREVQGLRVLSPVQLYLDLHAQRGRGEEAAAELLRRVLGPEFKPAGLALAKDDV